MENLELETIRRVLAGDTDAYRVLMDCHLPAVLRMTFRITGSMADAEEAAQEAFARAFEKLPTFREQAAFGTWVYRIAMNCSLNLVKRRNRDLAWDATPLDGSPASEDLAVSHHPTPEAAMLDAEAILKRERAMCTLTSTERTAFVLRHMEEQPIEVVATALGVTANTARQTIFRAVSKLRRALSPTHDAKPIAMISSRFAKESQ